MPRAAIVVARRASASAWQLGAALLTFDVVEPAARAGVTAALYGALTVALFVYLVGTLGLRSRRPSLDYATSSRLRLRSQ